MGEITVSVDQDFARFGKKSYAINKINSVEVREKHPYGRVGLVIWGLLAFICGANALMNLTTFAWGAAVTGLLFTALFSYLAYRAWLKSLIVDYHLFLMTSSSEAQALTSRDGYMIEGLRNKIERAMAGRLN